MSSAIFGTALAPRRQLFIIWLGGSCKIVKNAVQLPTTERVPPLSQGLHVCVGKRLATTTFWRLSPTVILLMRRVGIVLNDSVCMELATFSNLHYDFTSCARTTMPAMSNRGAGPGAVELSIIATHVYICMMRASRYNSDMSTPWSLLLKTL